MFCMHKEFQEVLLVEHNRICLCLSGAFQQLHSCLIKIEKIIFDTDNMNKYWEKHIPKTQKTYG